ESTTPKTTRLAEINTFPPKLSWRVLGSNKRQRARVPHLPYASVKFKKNAQNRSVKGWTGIRVLHLTRKTPLVPLVASTQTLDQTDGWTNESPNPEAVSYE
ncbi:MAG: hypothetical protein JSV76_00585, partial [Candidatus Bathyarchaeota archaeon]